MGIFTDLKVLFGGKQPTPPPQTVKNTPATKRVLIVEDETLLADALALKLRHAGFTVVRAENGKRGLEMAVAQQPHIILLDIMMPIMDGKVMLRKLREMPQFKNLPVLVLTNAGEVENIREMDRYYNASDFLVKSNVSPEEIVKRVKELLYIVS